MFDRLSKFLALAKTSPDVSHHRPYFPSSNAVGEMTATRGGPLITSSISKLHGEAHV